MTTTEYTFEHISTLFVRKAANYTGHRYRLYGVEADDVAQEIYVWLYGDGKAKVERWLEGSPQQTTRIYRSMLDKALQYAEQEKAVKVGYRPDDVFWYTASSVEGLMPLVLDATFVQEHGVIGELITMVVDIRRVMNEYDTEFFMQNDDSHPMWADHLRMIVDKLGGNRPYVGRRRAMSNAHSQAITSEAYG